MEPRGYKEDLREMILDMAYKELENYTSKKGANKFFEGNLDKIITDNIKKINQGIGVNKVYSSVLKKGSYQDNITSIGRLIKGQDLFKSKNELIKFARHLGINISGKSSYNQVLRKVSNHIYTNRGDYAKRFVSYKRDGAEYFLEPDKLKEQLVESYRSKTREDMKSIARLLDLRVDDECEAEEIRKKVINYIIKEKISKRNKPNK